MSSKRLEQGIERLVDVRIDDPPESAAYKAA
jgi:hypothetical protein